MLTWKYCLLLAPVLFCGCAHGFDRAALRDRLNSDAIQSTDSAIAEVRGLKPQLAFPCRIAVYVKPSSERDWRWTPDDRAALEQWAATLRKEGIASDVFLLPDMLTGKGDVKELRLAAAQCGADAIFIIRGAAQTDSYKNFASVFNITVVGGYIVPASHKDSLFMMEGILLDVDNGFVYAGVQTEGMGKIMRPSFVIEDKDSIAIAKSSAVAQFGPEVVKRMRAISLARGKRAVTEPNTEVTTVGGMAGPISKLDLHQAAEAGTPGALMPRITTPTTVVNPMPPELKWPRLPGPVLIDAAPGLGVSLIRDSMIRNILKVEHHTGGVTSGIVVPK